MNFEALLRKMRKGAGLSQEQLAEQMHISRSNISRLETGHLELKASDLINLANITQSQEVIAAMILGLDVAVLQQALELALKIVATIFIGGII